MLGSFRLSPVVCCSLPAFCSPLLLCSGFPSPFWFLLFCSGVGVLFLVGSRLSVVPVVPRVCSPVAPPSGLCRLGSSLAVPLSLVLSAGGVSVWPLALLGVMGSFPVQLGPPLRLPSPLRRLPRLLVPPFPLLVAVLRLRGWLCILLSAVCVNRGPWGLAPAGRPPSSAGQLAVWVFSLALLASFLLVLVLSLLRCL